jgi:hypothetical protein
MKFKVLRSRKLADVVARMLTRMTGDSHYVKAASTNWHRIIRVDASGKIFHA